jgi:hypothetical protein
MRAQDYPSLERFNRRIQEPSQEKDDVNRSRLSDCLIQNFLLGWVLFLVD